MGIFTPSSGGIWTLLEDETLAAAGKFDISSISAAFNHLWINLLVRGDVASDNDNIYLVFNGDTTVANYRRGFIQVAGGAASAGQDDNLIIAPCPAANAPANYFGIVDIKIPHYTGGHTKIAYSNFAIRSSAVNMLVGQYGVHWENAAVITQITLQIDNDPTDELVAGSRIMLYGAI